MDRTCGAGELVLGGLQTLHTLGAVGGLTDGHLIGRFVAGDPATAERAFEALLERHGPMVLGVCRRVLGDRHAAEDAFQATFLVLAKQARSIRRRDSVGGWLHRVARRIAGRAARSARRRRAVEEPMIEEVPEVREQGDPLERGDLRAALDEEIDRLGGARRQVVVLCDLEGLTYEQAAERLRWPPGTVKSRLSRARGLLRERLARRGVGPAVVGTAGAIAGAEAQAAVPQALAKAAVRSALGAASAGPVSLAVAALAGEEVKAMFLSRLLGVSCAMVVASALVVGLALAQRPGPAAGGDRAGGRGPLIAKVGPGEAAGDEDKGKDKGPRTLSASGTVVDDRGRPVPGATVLIREWVIRRTSQVTKEQEREMERTGQLPDVLARTEADAEGRFRLERVEAPEFPSPDDNKYLGKSWFPWDLVVLAKGHGVGWLRLTPGNQREPLTVALPKEARIPGRVTGTDGRPIAGVRLRVYEITRLSARAREDFESTEDRLGLQWSSVPIGATTDVDGRFVIAGLPPERRVSVLVLAAGFQGDVLHAATTDGPQPDLVDTTFHSGRTVTQRLPVRTGELVIALKSTDHRLLGRLVAEGSGLPVVGVDVLNGFKKVATTDAGGRFAIEGLPAGRVELHAKAWKDETMAPLDVAVEIPDGEKVIERTFQLPRGLAVSGRVVDGAGAGVAGAKLRYEHAAEGEGVPTLFGLEATSDAEGRFRLAVPAGRGAIVMVEAPAGHLGPGGRLVGSAPEARFSRGVQGASGDAVEGLTFMLDRGRRVALRAVGPDGRPVEGVELRRYGFSAQAKTPVQTDPRGRAEIVGLDPRGSFTIDVIHPRLKIGRRVEVGATDEQDAPGPIEVALTPLGSLEGKVLDEGGKPLAGPVLWLRTNAKAPEQIGAPVESRNRVGPDGSYRFDGLVPGGSYYVDVAVAGHAGANSKYVIAESGAVLRLDPFRLPVTDRALKGVVVDPRGRPVAGATVGLSQRGPTNFNPSGRWFMNTDASGRFDLTNLPRGPLTISAYRSPTGADRSITNEARVEVGAAQAEVRIELPDARRRLQGIED